MRDEIEDETGDEAMIPQIDGRASMRLREPREPPPSVHVFAVLSLALAILSCPIGLGFGALFRLLWWVAPVTILILCAVALGLGAIALFRQSAAPQMFPTYVAFFGLLLSVCITVVWIWLSTGGRGNFHGPN